MSQERLLFARAQVYFPTDQALAIAQLLQRMYEARRARHRETVQLHIYAETKE